MWARLDMILPMVKVWTDGGKAGLRFSLSWDRQILKLFTLKATEISTENKNSVRTWSILDNLKINIKSTNGSAFQAVHTYISQQIGHCGGLNIGKLKFKNHKKSLLYSGGQASRLEFCSLGNSGYIPKAFWQLSTSSWARSRQQAQNISKSGFTQELFESELRFDS